VTAPTLPMPQPSPAEPFPSPMPPPDYRTPCPTCGDPLPGLLALCWRPACVTAFLNEDSRYDNQDW
jgi:hypothetical protein